MNFLDLLMQVRTRANLSWKPPERLLSLDPGETLGWAFFCSGKLYERGQVSLTSSTSQILQLLKRFLPAIVVAEDYRIYSWEAKRHAWRDLFTPRLLGIIESLCSQQGIPLFLQMAGLPKGFCKDKRLREWGFYQRGQPHANDAIRHGTYFLLFGRAIIEAVPQLR